LSRKKLYPQITRIDLGDTELIMVTLRTSKSVRPLLIFQVLYATLFTSKFSLKLHQSAFFILFDHSNPLHWGLYLKVSSKSIGIFLNYPPTANNFIGIIKNSSLTRSNCSLRLSELYLNSPISQRKNRSFIFLMFISYSNLYFNGVG